MEPAFRAAARITPFPCASMMIHLFRSRQSRQRAVSRLKAMSFACCNRSPATAHFPCMCHAERGPAPVQCSLSMVSRACVQNWRQHANGHARSRSPTIDHEPQLAWRNNIMPKFPKIITAMIATIISLLVGLSSSAAQETRLLSAQPSLPAASAHGAARTHANSSARAATPKQFELARIAPSSAAKKEHRLILQVNTSDSASMNLALNNALNVAQHYKEVGEGVKVEVITFGPGLHMLRDDTSPVKARIEEMALSTPEVSFKACGNTQEKMQKAENKDIPIVAQAQVVRSGVVRVMQLQEQGWTYVKP